jgi:hypothetical protein
MKKQVAETRSNLIGHSFWGFELRSFSIIAMTGADMLTMEGSSDLKKTRLSK